MPDTDTDDEHVLLGWKLFITKAPEDRVKIEGVDDSQPITRMFWYVDHDDAGEIAADLLRACHKEPLVDVVAKVFPHDSHARQRAQDVLKALGLVRDP